jgi:biopolymer transport protein ExbD
MKFNKAQVEDVDVAIDMSAMIDMVFLLLIFFIVASAVIDIDKPPVTVPTVVAAKVAKTPVGRVNVSINKEEQMFFRSKPVTIDELKTLLSAELDRDPNLRVFIRSDEEVPYLLNKKLMRACAEVGAIDLIYAAFEK